MNAKQAGLIGHGRLGSLFASILRHDFKLKIFDSNSQLCIPESEKSNLISTVNCELVFIAVPVSQLEILFQKIQPHLLNETTIVELSAAKSYSTELFRKHFLNHPNFVACHPLFGPDATRKGLKNLKAVLCGSTHFQQEKLIWLDGYLRGKGIQTIHIDAEDHDYKLARGVCLTQFLGRALQPLLLEDSQLDTRLVGYLREIQQVASNDADTLFSDMISFNPFFSDVLEQLKNVIHNLETDFLVTKATGK